MVRVVVHVLAIRIIMKREPDDEYVLPVHGVKVHSAKNFHHNAIDMICLITILTRNYRILSIHNDAIMKNVKENQCLCVESVRLFDPCLTNLNNQDLRHISP